MFVPLFQVDTFCSDNKNAATERRTNSDMKVFTEFLDEKGETRPIETIPPIELDTLVSMFVISVRKVDGSEYEPVSLRTMVSTIDRYLKEKQYALSNVRSIKFARTQEALQSKLKQLKRDGKGNQPCKSDVLTRR